ncbi:unnamed protein product [Protopolystoma xenopodis]|uniref:Uncharacterized protein n=1 Tax=Protopolystoma xenopodis TaxID=117903 RepID=A0A3S5BL00_9PLAT|nr:unnamed protein product [Protopolystoma xenopodis]
MTNKTKDRSESVKKRPVKRHFFGDKPSKLTRHLAVVQPVLPAGCPFGAAFLPLTRGTIIQANGIHRNRPWLPPYPFDSVRTCRRLTRLGDSDPSGRPTCE